MNDAVANTARTAPASLQRLRPPPELTEPGTDVPAAALPDEDPEAIYKQFLLDVPRIDVTLNGVAVTSNNPTLLFFEIFELFRPRRVALDACRYLTQGVLALHFARAYAELGDERFHLVDGGRQAVAIDAEERTVSIRKPFNVVVVDEAVGELRILSSRTLRVVKRLDGHGGDDEKATWTTTASPQIVEGEEGWMLV